MAVLSALAGLLSLGASERDVASTMVLSERSDPAPFSASDGVRQSCHADNMTDEDRALLRKAAEAPPDSLANVKTKEELEIYAHDHRQIRPFYECGPLLFEERTATPLSSPPQLQFPDEGRTPVEVAGGERPMRGKYQTYEVLTKDLMEPTPEGAVMTNKATGAAGGFTLAVDALDWAGKQADIPAKQSVSSLGPDLADQIPTPGGALVIMTKDSNGVYHSRIQGTGRTYKEVIDRYRSEPGMETAGEKRYFWVERTRPGNDGCAKRETPAASDPGDSSMPPPGLP